MKKKELINYLQSIKGNPEVVFYNGFVEDWQHIQLSEYVLERTVAVDNVMRRIINIERHDDGLDDISDDDFNTWLKINKIGDWYVNNQHSHSFQKVQKKKVIMIQTKERKKSCFDRCGSIRY